MNKIKQRRIITKPITYMASTPSFSNKRSATPQIIKEKEIILATMAVIATHNGLCFLKQQNKGTTPIFKI